MIRRKKSGHNDFEVVFIEANDHFSGGMDLLENITLESDENLSEDFESKPKGWTIRGFLELIIFKAMQYQTSYEDAD